MCDPVSLGITGASKVASSHFSKKAEKKVKRARENVQARANADIGGFRDEARGEHEKALNAAGAAGMGEAMAKAEADRAASYEGAIKESPAVINESASDAGKRAIVKALTAGTVNSRDLARRRAAVDAYGDAAGGRDITMGRAGLGIAQNADFARGRAEVADMELEAANNAGNKYANIAGMIDGLGKIAGAAYTAGAGGGLWGGTDPSNGIKWASGRVAPGAGVSGPNNPNLFGPYKPGQVGYYRIGV